MKSSNKQLLALAIAAVNCAPVAVLAQSETEKKTVLEEVVVTASRRAESIQDIPYNITAVTGEFINDIGADDLSKMSQFIPGMQMIDAGARSTGLVTLRGMNVGGLEASENQGGKDIISRYVNDTPLLIDFKLVDIERVEVLRGPQGTLYGRGAMAGTLRYILNKPNTEATEGSLRTEVYKNSESDGFSNEVSGVLNLPLSDTLALRMSGTRVDDAGFVDYNNVLAEPGVSNDERKIKDANTEEATSARIALRWEPTDTFFAQANYYLQDSKAGGRQAVNPGFTGDDFTSSLRYEEVRENKDTLFNVELGYNSDAIEIFSTTSVAEYEGIGNRDQTDLLCVDIWSGYCDFPQFSAYTVDDNQSESLVHETRFLSTDENSPEWLDWIAGVYYEETDTLLDAREYTPGFGDFVVNEWDWSPTGLGDLEYWRYADSTFKEQAVYGEATFHANEQLQFTLGARYFQQEEKFAYDCTMLPFYTGTDPDCRDGDGEIDDTVFKLNAAYNFTDDVMLYATVAEGFRRGGTNAGPQLLDSEQTFSSDSVVNYELGWHTTLGGNIILNGAVFMIDWSDLQVPTKSQEAAINITKNASQGQISGLELSAQAALSDNLMLNGWVTYYDHALDGDAPEIGGYDGDSFPGVPNLQYNLALDYNVAVPTGELTLRGNMYYKDAVDTRLNSLDDNFDNETLKDYHLFNLSADYRLDQWRASLFADNVTNELYYNGVRSAKRYGERGQFYYVGQPRTFGVNVAYEF
ncbi:TonB-dependent receptor [Microbulbifer sp. CAU 1566]|uniref:TonB-dependent receptor n=1 Tax=Microbulbifer sp. CAU 1566 TaxID=2933269 RepID=UPI0020056C68|nr:TonB-dependent receptor [Microbulbifer sp. CAU 1566]MCK7598017.1 TonB-dependent receptor [Microbulbifer sp. CAU 1566]